MFHRGHTASIPAGAADASVDSAAGIPVDAPVCIPARIPVRRAAGFTLIETMITVLVVSILAAVAIPNYAEHVRRGAIPVAHANLADLRLRLEQYYQSNRNFGTVAAAPAPAPAPAPVGTTPASDCGSPGLLATYNVPGAQFVYSCRLSDAGQNYVATATGNAGAANGHVYTIDAANARATALFKNKAKSSDCWLVKGDEC
jgi:type IV pilus assembly protein PilE